MARDGDSLQDGSQVIAAEDFKQSLFGFGSDLIQDGLHLCIHAARASRVLRWVCHIDRLIDLGERNVLG